MVSIFEADIHITKDIFYRKEHAYTCIISRSKSLDYDDFFNFFVIIFALIELFFSIFIKNGIFCEKEPYKGGI